MPLMGWCQSGHHADCPSAAKGGTYTEPKQEPYEYPMIVCSCMCHEPDYSPHA